MEHTNGILDAGGSPLMNGAREASLEELERELPMVYDGQVSLGDVLSRVVQAIYAELCELAETCASSDTRSST
jgi:mediator of RNA polymerase II transcription subunit 14